MRCQMSSQLAWEPAETPMNRLGWGGGNQPDYRGLWCPLQAMVHFIGGAFVGAAPQLTYRLFLETLAARGFVVSQ